MKKIFIIEDDPDISAVLNMVLSTTYILEILRDCGDLIGKIKKFLPDLIMTDYFVGQLVCTEIIGQVSAVEQLKNIPVILFSGHPEIARYAKEINAAGYLNKPFDLKNLNSLVQKVIGEKTLAG